MKGTSLAPVFGACLLVSITFAQAAETTAIKIGDHDVPEVWPGRGVVALTAYSYHYCDNDSYNETGLSVVTNQPGASNWGELSLLGQSFADHFWGYVLKLPVVRAKAAEAVAVGGHHDAR